MTTRNCKDPTSHGGGGARYQRNVHGWRAVVAGLVFPVLAGMIVGAAWREILPALTGLLGLGVFFWVQVRCKRLLNACALALLTGFVGQLTACGSWLISTAGTLAGTGAVVSCVLAALICLFHSLVFCTFAVVFWMARNLLSRVRQSSTQTQNRRQRKQQLRRKAEEQANNMGWQMNVSNIVDRLSSELCVWQLSIAPILWGLAEFLTPVFYPFSIGYLLADHPALCQLAEIGGVYLLSVFAATIALTLPLAVVCLRFFLSKDPYQYRGWQDVAIPVSVALLMMAVTNWSFHRKNEINRVQSAAESRDDGIRLLLVQAETETSVANGRMISASRKVADQADLVLWPEAALGNYNRELVDFSNTKAVAENSIGRNTRFRPFPDAGVFLLAGADTWVAGRSDGVPAQNFVSALLLNRQEQLVGRHDKVELMPYGEYIPGEQMFPQIREWLGSTRIISRGREIETIGEVKGQRLGVLLCCEDMDPELFRTLVKKKANVLVSLGNGMAFDSELPLRQHFRISRLRSIENRRYFARCMSRGVSVLLSPTGEVVHELPSMQDGAMFFELPKLKLISTLYSQFGQVPFLLFSSFGSLAWFLIAKRFASCE